eukprot:SAG22_NODE_536_length_9364_cov_15.973988_2_plen_138_part_00
MSDSVVVSTCRGSLNSTIGRILLNIYGALSWSQVLPILRFVVVTVVTLARRWYIGLLLYSHSSSLIEASSICSCGAPRQTRSSSRGLHLHGPHVEHVPRFHHEAVDVDGLETSTVGAVVVGAGPPVCPTALRFFGRV